MLGPITPITKFVLSCAWHADTPAGGTGQIPVLVSDLDLECKMWLKIRLAPMCPWFGTVSLAFVGPPTIKVQLLPYNRVRLMKIPFLQVGILAHPGQAVGLLSHIIAFCAVKP